MFTDDSIAEELARLKRERDEADRVYNERLTQLDAAIAKPRDVPQPPAGYDEYQINALNERWELLSLKPHEGSGWLKRLRAHAWAMLAPLFERQQAFNSAVVDHVNRNVAMHRDVTRAMEGTLAVLGEDHQRLIEFQTRLIVYLQQITPYVDTKDRDVSGFQGLAAGLSELGDKMQKHWESLAAREQRFAAQVNDVRTTLGVMQRAVQTLKREMERTAASEDIQTTPRAESERIAVASGSSAAPRALDSYKYVGFEDRFRGSQQEIRDRMEAYLPLFDGAADVLDVGCGRGEFLELLRARGIRASGIDLNDEMASVARERGLEARAGDALSHLMSLPDGSLGGLFAGQVVEHLEPDYLTRLLETSYHKLRPGSKIVLETINVGCWFAFFSSYVRDITHVRPLHPDTLQYLLGASGFQNVSIRYSAPYPEESKLQRVRVKAGVHEARGPEVTFNENFAKLNSLLFTHLDYAAIGERL